MTPNEWATLAKDLALAGAAVATAIIAYLGLDKWRQELRGRSDFEVARHVIRATYKLRDLIQGARAPFYVGHEFPEGYDLLKAGSRTGEEEANAWAHVYESRMRPVWSALEEFDAQTLEAEALWGPFTIRHKADALRICLWELRAAMEADLRDKAADGADFKADAEFGKKMRAVVSGSREDPGNTFNRKLAEAVSGIEDALRPHLSRGRKGGGMEKAKARGTTEKGDDDDASDGFKAYLEYNRVLRTWFVAFGVGGPALFLVNDEIAGRLVDAGQLRIVVILFLAGATAQVLGALLNKIANWYVYIGTIDAAFKGTIRHRIAEWLIGQFWIDILIDVVTIAAFGAAAWFLMTVFAKV